MHVYERFTKPVLKVALTICELSRSSTQWNSFHNGWNFGLRSRRYVYIGFNAKMERKPNRTEGQEELLIDLVTDEERWSMIRGKFGPTLTVQTQHNAWTDVTERYETCRISNDFYRLSAKSGVVIHVYFNSIKYNVKKVCLKTSYFINQHCAMWNCFLINGT